VYQFVGSGFCVRNIRGRSRRSSLFVAAFGSRRRCAFGFTPFRKSVQNPYKSDRFREHQFSTSVKSTTYKFNALKCADFSLWKLSLVLTLSLNRNPDLHPNRKTGNSGNVIRTNPDDVPTTAIEHAVSQPLTQRPSRSSGIAVPEKIGIFRNSGFRFRRHSRLALRLLPSMGSMRSFAANSLSPLLNIYCTKSAHTPIPCESGYAVPGTYDKSKSAYADFQHPLPGPTSLPLRSTPRCRILSSNGHCQRLALWSSPLKSC
jgi:hypothetical protein